METEGPITVVVSRRVRPGLENKFRTWVNDIAKAAEHFQGHLGSGYIRPVTAEGEHTIIYRFDTVEHFDSWQNSDERAYWINQSREFIEGEPHVDKATGLEYWFHDPACSYGTPPPIWKQALLTEIGLFPTVLVISYTIGMLLNDWPLPIRTLVFTILSVLIMTWFVMPNISRLTRPWLQQKK
ncbi:MAG: antibiotic biosynthesis monooxygenase [Dethiobacteria bacterium]